MLDWLDKFHKSRLGYGVFALVELVLAYVCVSWAINSGNWLAYLLTVIFLVGFLQNALRLLVIVVWGKRRG